MSQILFATGAVAAIGLILAVILTLADRFMGIKVDEKEARIRECLPGANCGMCGYSGCDGYAKALAEGKGVKPNLCRPGGQTATEKIAAILGVKADYVEPMVAFVHCNGDCNKNGKKATYAGLSTCAGAKMLYGGEGACVYGCLGFGDCQTACNYHAICIENGIAHIDGRACVGCGACAAVCPNKVISIIPKLSVPAVACSNHEKGAVTRKECSGGCIGCMKCQKNCPVGAITVVNNCAQIDYTKCTRCRQCVELCPVGCLRMINTKLTKN